MSRQPRRISSQIEDEAFAVHEFKRKASEKYKINNYEFNKLSNETIEQARDRLHTLGVLFRIYFPQYVNKYLNNYNELVKSRDYTYIEKVERPQDYSTNNIPDGSTAYGLKKKHKKTMRKRKNIMKKKGKRINRTNRRKY
jgi:hypothetical protein